MNYNNQWNKNYFISDNIPPDKWYEILKSRAPRGKGFLIVESSVWLYCRQIKLLETVLFLQFFCEIRLVETMLIRCFIVFIVILVLSSVRKQGFEFSFFALEYEVKRSNNLPFNAFKPNFVAIYVFFRNNFVLSNRGETGSHLVSLQLLGAKPPS